MQEPTYRVELTFAPDLRDRVERWRGRQFPVLTRAEAVRRLVLAGLEGGGTVPAADAPAPVTMATDIPPFPSGTRAGDAQINVKIPAGVSDQLDWVAKVRGWTKREVVSQLVRDGALRLAKELGVVPAGQ
jgi:hypothetical protein